MTNMTNSRALEILTRRMASDRQRSEKLRADRYTAGFRQMAVWLSEDEIAQVDRLKAALGVENRSGVVSALLRGFQP